MTGLDGIAARADGWPESAAVIDMAAFLGSSAVRLERGVNGYARSHALLDAEGVKTAVVLAGGQNEGVHVRASGEDADLVAGGVRVLWPDHAVARADVCIDMDEDGLFELLAADLRARAVKTGLKLRLIADPERPDEGRTLYVGSRESPLFARLYEKGKKLRGELRTKGVPFDHVSASWVRFEVEAKPVHRDGKERLSKLAAVDVFGTAKWSRQFVDEVFELGARAAPPRPARQGDDARAFAFMVKQYGAVLERLAAREGGWAALGERIGDTRAGVVTPTGGPLSAIEADAVLEASRAQAETLVANLFPDREPSASKPRASDATETPRAPALFE